MKYRIAMLLKYHLMEYCQSVIGDRFEQMELIYHPYETLHEAEQLFHSFHKDYDGIITSGLIPHGLLKTLPKEKEICFAHFRFDIENTYRIILQQSVMRKRFDLSRIGMDFLPQDRTLEDIISKNELPKLVKQFEADLASIPANQLDAKEEKVALHYLDQYNKGNLDFIVTYFYSTVLAMKRHNIDCYYLYPSHNEIQYVMDSIKQKIRLTNAKKGLPGVIRVDMRKHAQMDHSQELVALEIQKAILEFIQPLSGNLSVKSGFQHFELYTDSDTIATLTKQYQCCSLYKALGIGLPFNGTIGYGIGTDFYHARANAIDASNYGTQFHDDTNVSFLINEREQLYRLPTQEEAHTSWIVDIPSDYVRKIASTVKLSTETILKIINVLYMANTDEITSLDLINRLGISSRTANRYLANLMQYGYAHIIGQQTPKGKGRPINRYQLTLLPRQ